MAQAERDWRRQVRWMLVVALVALLAWWFLRDVGTVVVDVETPAGAGEAPVPAGGVAMEPPEAVEAEEDGEAEPEVKRSGLHIWLRELDDVRFISRAYRPPFEAVWPSVNDAGWNYALWDGYETDDILRDVAVAPNPFRDPIGDELVAIAEAEGLLGEFADLSTPESALMALYAEWTRSAVQNWKDYLVWDGENLAEGLTWSTITVEERRAFIEAGNTPYSKKSHARQEEITRTILERWPDHPVAEHAVLSELSYRLGGDWKDRRVEQADEMADRIANMSSGHLKERAAFLIGSISYSSPRLLDVVDGIPFAEPNDEMAMNGWIVWRAAAAQDWPRLARATKKMRQGIDGWCPTAAIGHQALCDFQNYNLRDAMSRLVALGHADPATWQEALHAEAWTCHLEHPHEGLTKGLAIWDGEGWSWGEFDVPTATTDCLRQVRHTALDPDEPLEVMLTVEGPSEEGL